MKKIFLFVAVALSLNSAYAVREVQNGGTGIRVDGSYLTYYSAQGTYRQPVEVSDRMPGLDLLVREIIDLPLESWNKLETLKYFDFTNDRKYFRLSQNQQLDEALRDKITDDYATMMNVPRNQVVIFAVTNPATLSTVLMPEFFTLTPSEQAAMLVHESMWLTRDATYEKVITAEQITQAYLEDKTSASKYYRFVNLINNLRGDPLFKIKAGLQFDLRMKRLSPSIVYSRRIYLKDFLSETELNRLLCPNISIPDDSADVSRQIYFRSRLEYNKKESSLFYTAFYEFLENRGIIMIEHDASCLKRESIDALIESAQLDISTFYSMPNLYLKIVNPDGRILGKLSFRPN